MAKRLRKLSFDELLRAAKGQLDIDPTSDLKEAANMDAAAQTAGILTKSSIPVSAKDSTNAKLEARIAELEKALLKSAGDDGMHIPAGTSDMHMPAEEKGQGTSYLTDTDKEEADETEAERKREEMVGEEKSIDKIGKTVEPSEAASAVGGEPTMRPDGQWAATVAQSVREMQSMKSEMQTLMAQLAQQVAEVTELKKAVAKTSKRVESGTASQLTPEMTTFLAQQFKSQKSVEKEWAFDSVQDN